MNDIVPTVQQMVAPYIAMDYFVAFSISAFTCFTFGSMCLVCMAWYDGGV
jgi:hypothetical protein